jgi:hypothetical protein
MSAFVGALAAAGGLAKVHDSDPREHTTLYRAVRGHATYNATRTC